MNRGSARVLTVLMLTTSFPASADQTFKVCMGGNGCPWAGDTWFPCGTSIDQMAVNVCTITADGKKTVSPYRVIQKEIMSGGACGFGLWEVTCVDN
ncbi:hypothetical protein [Mesorhizobium sp. M0187]|uniref:hypothetical protein n=1 Tax=Mesorhizobium sp. M0187 TaxID=2956908 RepID=UPI003336487A